MRQRLGSIRHLVARFFGHLTAVPPGPEDQQFVHDHLNEPCADLFWAQSGADQNHAVGVARRVARLLGDDRETIEAALLHDVGKLGTSAGAISRSVATILDAARLPMPERMRTYREHGPRGAVMLEEAECGPLAIAFTRHHPASTPPGVESGRWDALTEADG